MKTLLYALAACLLLAAPVLAAQPVTINNAANTDSAGVTNHALNVNVSTAYGGRVAAAITRPANTTQYTANTAWANATSAATYSTFTGVCRANGTEVVDADIVFLDNANQATKLSGVLFLFNAPVGTPVNDNATFSIASADFANLVAQIPFTASTVTNQGSGSAGSTMAEVQGVTYQFNCGASTTNLYGMVEVTNTYTPISGEILTAILKPIGVN